MYNKGEDPSNNFLRKKFRNHKAATAAKNLCEKQRRRHHR